ncbi:RTA1 like protein-domain-containing protein [Apodospora peruviana]|uniref:RTA1 like protein-domain-containing protein n=1 Tax=Apodospora peruviana TaxID=516989 RepID=A0AAE0HWM3_9PEZI|nr:RTA1 like protein-domain-containing protein [Apodospora peruviana]
MEDGKYVPGSIYFYAPNKGAPVFFAVAFATSGIFHIYQCIHYKSWRLTGIYVFCAVIFTAGFIVREMGAFDYENLVKFIITICLVYAAPPLFELANYNILGRILYYVPYHSPIHPGRVVTTLGFISAVVEALNGNGASYSSNRSLPEDKQNIGKALIKASLLIQIVVICLFLVLAGIFHHRCQRSGVPSDRLRSALFTLYASTALLTVRTIFRIVEYFSLAQLHFGPGLDPTTLSPLIRYEWFFYVFEASLMICNIVLMNVRHPRKYLPKSTKTYLAKDGVTEVTGPGHKDARPFLQTLFDPFDLIGLLKGKDKGKRFWETDELEGVGGGEKTIAAAGMNRKRSADVEAAAAA